MKVVAWLAATTAYTVLALVLWLWLVLGAQAQSYSVAVTGSDANPCTFTQPCRTIRAGVAKLTPGATLLIQAGIYTDGLYNVPSGTASAPVTIQAAPGAVVLIKPVGQDGIHLTPASYVIVRDLTLDGGSNGQTADVQGIYLSDGAHHNTFQRVRVRGWPNAGIIISRNNGQSPFNAVLDSWVHNNGSGTQNTNGHGLYISSPDTRIEGNEIYDNLGYGVHVYDDPGFQSTHRTLIRHNKIYRNGRSTATSFGIILNEGRDSIVDGNQVYNNRGGIQVSLSAVNAQILHNTLVSNVDYGIQSTPTATVTGNIVYQNGTGIAGGGSLVSKNLLTNPLFVDQANADFRLRPGSPAIVVGGRDLGALESGEIVTPPPDPPAPCVYAVSKPGTQVFPLIGGTTSVTVTTQAGCRWEVTDEGTWLSVSPPSGVGTRSLVITVLAAKATRTTQVVVAGLVFSIRQGP